LSGWVATSMRKLVDALKYAAIRDGKFRELHIISM